MKIRYIAFWLFGFLFCQTGGLKAQESVVYVIDKNTKYQNIDNFSASDAWRMDFVGKNWPLEKKEHIADLLFKREFDKDGNPKGMALTNWRVNIGAGSYENRENKEVTSTWNRTECFLSPNGTYDFTKQAGQQWFMNAARERGMNDFLFFTNSAPYFMTRTGSTLSADNKCINLRHDKFDDFARFLVHCVKHFKENGYNIKYVSPLNEPNVEWHTNSWQEGTFATKSDIYKMVSELDKAISENGVDTKIIVPELGEMKMLFEIDANENTPDNIIRSMFYKDGEYNVLSFKNLYNCVAAHDYWTAYPPNLLVDIRTQIRDSLAGNNSNTKFWASEYCILEKNEEITMPPSPVKSINLGLYVARLIHTNLAVANASAWQWWTAVSLNEDVPIQLLPMEGASSETVKYDGRIVPTKMFWATANYSFFVRPGMHRVDVRALNQDATPLEAATSLMLSSYTDGSQVVTVIVNYTDADKNLSLKCDNARKGKLYVTSIDKDLQYIGKQPLKSLSIPARSVVTVVIDGE
jgi:O-glycosyl hydrolase